MMFEWHNDMIRFMRDASNYGDYHDRLAEWMLPELQASDHICDAGCGLGYLSLSLSPHVRQITAADCSEAALSVLRENCVSRKIKNIDILSGDIFSSRPQTPFDAMVFCFFGRMEEIAAVAKVQCRGTVFAFKKNYHTHRFSVESHPAGDDSFSAGIRWLTEHGVPFVSEELKLEMGQPLRSWDEARHFFELYSHDTDKSVITDAFLRSKLIETGRKDFPLYLPHIRSVGCLRFSAENLRQYRITGL